MKILLACLLIFFPLVMEAQSSVKVQADKHLFILGDVIKGDTLVPLRKVREMVGGMRIDVLNMLKNIEANQNEERQRILIYITKLQKELDEAKKKSCKIAEET